MRYSLLIISILSAVTLLPACGNKCQTKDRYLVVTTFAGMANRLRLLASAKIMAALTGRQLVVDWPILENEMPGAWKDFFQNPIVTFEDSMLAKQGCRLESITSAESDSVIKNLGNQNYNDARKVLNVLPQLQEPIVYFASSLNFQPDEQFMPASEYVTKRSLWYKNLDPIPWINDSINAFKKTHKFDDYYMIGIHYRGWQMGAPDVRDAGAPDQSNKYVAEFITKMRAALAKPLSDTNNKPVAFYLSTDNEKAKQDIMAVPEFKDRVFARSEKADRSTIKGQQSDMVDFFLLGATNYIIGTYQSSFSDEAAHLTVQDRKEDIGEAVYK